MPLLTLKHLMSAGLPVFSGFPAWKDVDTPSTLLALCPRQEMHTLRHPTPEISGCMMGKLTPHPLLCPGQLVQLVCEAGLL